MLDKIICSSDDALDAFKTAIYNLIVEINNQAYDMQQKNQLKPYILTTQLNYTKEEIEDLLKQSVGWEMMRA